MIARTLVAAAALTAVAAPFSAAGTPSAPIGDSTAAVHGRVVLDGDARFEVLTPTLIRLEYAADGHFENLPTMTAVNRDQPVPHFTVSDRLGQLRITTAKLTLTYVSGSGEFTAANVTVRIGSTTAHPTWDTCQDTVGNCSSVKLPSHGTQIGGWTREATSENVHSRDVFNPVQPGFLNTDGWFLLDDTDTAILTSPKTAVARPKHTGPYQDGYLFGYGDDYRTGLGDFASLTGHAPLLPEWTFGPWYSDYAAISAAQYEHGIWPKLSKDRIPLQGLVVDTDFKAPDSWNGWEWNKTLFPHPRAFIRWAKRRGLHVVLNIHPSIDETDPAFPHAQKVAHGTLKQGNCVFYRQQPACYVFDWGKPAEARAYFELHQRFKRDGVSAFWLDWCCDSSSVSTPGLTPDSWINHLYALHSPDPARGFVLSRIGSGINLDNSYTGNTVVPDSGPWADHRSAIAFTGSPTSDWQTLAFEVALTAGEGAAIGEPYISNDIGGYTGNHLSDALYVRWVEMGALSPIMRLHSHHGQRLPWQYDARARVPAARFLRLREQLLPYLYTTAEEAHATGIPMARAMAVEWPHQADAVKATSEWMLGDNLLAAPISSNRDARSVWIPPGRWTDFWTDHVIKGPRTITTRAGLATDPMWIRGVLPTGTKSQLTVFAAKGSPDRYRLYADAGHGAGFLHGQRTWTAISSNGRNRVTIGAERGHYPGEAARRSYTLEFLDRRAPRAVIANRQEVAWRYLPRRRAVIADVPAMPVDRRLVVRLARSHPAEVIAGSSEGSLTSAGR